MLCDLVFEITPLKTHLILLFLRTLRNQATNSKIAQHNHEEVCA